MLEHALQIMWNNTSNLIFFILFTHALVSSKILEGKSLSSSSDAHESFAIALLVFSLPQTSSVAFPNSYSGATCSLDAVKLSLELLMHIAGATIFDFAL